MVVEDNEKLHEFYLRNSEIKKILNLEIHFKE